MVLHIGWPNWYGLEDENENSAALPKGHSPISTFDEAHKYYLQEFRRLRMNLTENILDGLHEFDANQVEYWPMVLAMVRAYMTTRFEELGQKIKFDMDQLVPGEPNAEYDLRRNQITIGYYYMDIRYG